MALASLSLYCLFWHQAKTGEGSSQYNTVLVKGSDFEVFEALAVDSIGTESAKSGEQPSVPGMIMETCVLCHAKQRHKYKCQSRID